MDASFELKSSMSPKITRNINLLSKKPPSRLALKKYFRRSSLPVKNHPRQDESVIIIESTSSESCSSSSCKASNESPIILSNSELSYNSKQSGFKTPSKQNCKNKGQNCNPKNVPTNSGVQLSDEKYRTIKQWLSDVKNTEQDISGFSEISSIQKDENHSSKNSICTKEAVSSTVIEPSSKRFDELFRKPGDLKDWILSTPKDQVCTNNIQRSGKDLNNEAIKFNTEIDDSLMTEDDSKVNLNEIDKLEDSFFQLILDDSLSSRLNKQTEKNKTDLNNSNSVDNFEYENLLDDLYGNSWREKQEDILPSSEPRPTKTRKQIVKQPPKSERAIKTTNKMCPTENENNSNNLLRTLQKARFRKALESPWVKSLKNVCDSDTDSEDDNTNNLRPLKLDFRDNNDKENQINGLDSSSSSDAKGQVKKQTSKDVKAKYKKKRIVSKKEDETACYSFLASLSANVPMSKCNMTAWIYRKSFKEHKEQLVTKLFKLYNEEIFEDAIPADTPVEWNDRMRGTAGYCYCRKITRRTGAIERAARIVLSSKVLDSADRVRDTLVHEMCHAATWIVNQVADGHGSFWKSWADRAMSVFPELPPIKRCHQYVINTKYTYKCTSCGYSIGRHTKSLDTDRKRCGYCYGKFEVFINKTTKSGETKSVPATPKPLSGFAQFVKENYATHKTTDLKHAAVMKILGQKFSALKVDQS